MSAESQPILQSFDVERGIATIAFNRPEVFNALNIQAAEEFERAVSELHSLAGLRCVVLTGKGKAFMAGGDVGAFAADLPNASRILAQILRHMHPALNDLRSLNAPILAAVNGSAAGAGLSLVLGSDYVVAKSSSKFVLAYDKLGASPDCGGSWFLARKVGRSRAFEMMLNGKSLTADEARVAGIVNEVAADAEFDALVTATAARIAAGPTLAFGQFKKLLDQDIPLASHLEAERAAFMTLTHSADFQDAARAFVEKRPPSFRGR